jgi:predicted DNA-binding protein
MAKKLTTLYMDVELIEQLNTLSAKTRVPKAVYIRNAIDLVLRKHEKHLKGRQKKEKDDNQKRSLFMHSPPPRRHKSSYPSS